MMKQSSISTEGMIDKIRPESIGNTANHVAERIKKMIITNELPPQFMFPCENAFCEQLGIGRSTLREAYKSLESLGLITRTKRGTFVNDTLTIAASMPFRTTIEMSDLKELLEFRSMFEAELAGLAAQRASDENIENMRKYLASMKEHQDDLIKLTYYDMQFHMEIARASKNNMMINTMYAVSESFSKGIYSAFLVDTEANVKQALSYHEGILFAIEQKDPSIARNTMRSHVHSVYDRLGHTNVE